MVFAKHFDDIVKTTNNKKSTPIFTNNVSKTKAITSASETTSTNVATKNKNKGRNKKRTREPQQQLCHSIKENKEEEEKPVAVVTSGHETSQEKISSVQQPSKKKKKTRPPKKKINQECEIQHRHKRSSINNIDDSSKPSSYLINTTSKDREEKINLSNKLKELSKQKRISDLLQLYFDSSDRICDEYHSCIVIDCCGRCNRLNSNIIDKILRKLSTTSTIEDLNVETKTAIIKGYMLSPFSIDKTDDTEKGRKEYSGVKMFHIQKAIKLYKNMELSSEKRQRPNVRTMNTLLRGCLWAPSVVVGVFSSSFETSQQQQEQQQYEIYGGVITSEEAWISCKRRYHNLGKLKQGKKKPKQQLDAPMVLIDCSSYEYTITLLCRSLRCNEAWDRICEMKQFLNISLTYTRKTRDIMPATAGDNDPTVLESYGISLLCLSRGYALLGRIKDAIKAAKNALTVIEMTISLYRNSSSNSNSNSNDINSNSKKSTGGKHAWKSHNDNSNVTGNGTEYTGTSRRSVSNALFRSHRLSEIKDECNLILECCCSSSLPTTMLTSYLTASSTAFHLVTRLLFFSGTISNDNNTSNTGIDKLRLQLFNTLWLSFGLQSACQSSNVTLINRGKSEILNEEECKNIRRSLGIGDDMHNICDSGYIDFAKVFIRKEIDCFTEKDITLEEVQRKKSKCKSKKKPINIELGAGFGEWIASQAQLNPDVNYVAVELRSDRVAQIFSKAMFNDGKSSLENLCCVGSDSCYFLQRHVRPKSVRTIFINHPEPPTQTYGTNDTVLAGIMDGMLEEPSHMLTSDTLVAAALCLETNADDSSGGDNEGTVISPGRIVIVTDNRWYGRLICATLVKVMRKNNALLESVDLTREPAAQEIYYHSEIFPSDGSVDSSKAKYTVFLHEGQPSISIGHESSKQENDRNGSSYFDRLWRTGVGAHADRKKRYIIVLERPSDNTKFIGDSISNRNSKTNKMVQGGGKHRKKSEAKQRRRNERRLMKRKEEKIC